MGAETPGREKGFCNEQKCIKESVYGKRISDVKVG
jgi:hypothetical protein